MLTLSQSYQSELVQNELPLEFTKGSIKRYLTFKNFSGDKYIRFMFFILKSPKSF
jgi:hypothetical protein